MLCRWTCHVFWGLILLVSPAHAFKQKGHASVERAAYEILFTEEKDREALQELIAAGILKAPTSLDQEMAYHGLRIRSHMSDNSMERQLQSYGQCFHFMARVSDMTESNGKIGGIPERAVVDAYLRCMNLVDTLFRSILYDPKESHESKLDVYGLMHIIADTFSEAHVVRHYANDESYADCKKRAIIENPSAVAEECSGKIAYLKSWRLRAWVPFLFHPSAWQYYFDDTHHGVFVEPRDDDYLNTTLPDCASQAAASVVEMRCLSDPALRAADALADALRLLAKASKNRVLVEPSVRTSRGLNDQLQVFYHHYLDHVPLPNGKPISIDEAVQLKVLFGQGDALVPASNIEAQPLRDLGVALSFDLSADEPVWLSARFFGLRDALSSDSFTLSDLTTWTLELRLPLSDSRGQRPLGAAAQWGLKVPVDLIPAPNYGLMLSVQGPRVEYSVAAIDRGVARHGIGFGFGGISLDFTALGYLWFGMEGPRCMLRYDAWLNKLHQERSYWGVKAGGAFGNF